MKIEVDLNKLNVEELKFVVKLLEKTKFYASEEDEEQTSGISVYGPVDLASLYQKHLYIDNTGDKFDGNVKRQSPNESMYDKLWTKSEVKKLVELYFNQHKSVSEVAKLLKRNIGSITNVIYRYRKGYYTNKKVRQRMNNKTALSSGNSVVHKPLVKENKRWTDSEVKLFKQHISAGKSYKWMSKFYGRSVPALYKKKSKLKLR